MHRFKWISVTFLVLALYNGALGSLAIWQRTDLLEGALRETRVAAGTLVAEIENSLDRADRTLSGISEVLQASPAIQKRHDPYAHRLLIRRHAISPIFQALFLVGADGKLSNSSSTAEITPIDVSDRDYFKEHEQNGFDGLFIGRTIRSRLDGGLLIPISRASIDQFGRISMVIGATMPPRVLEQMIDAHSLPDGFRVAVTLRDGSPIACRAIPSCPGEGNNDNFAQELSFPSSDQANGQHVSYLPGEAGVGSFVRGPKYGISVAVQGDENLILQTWKSKLQLIVTMALLGSLVLFGGIIALHHQIRHRRLAMIKLEQANASLEIKVAERTKELAEGEERLRSFIMATRDAVVIIDQNGLIREFNPSATELFGYSAIEILGKSVNELMPDNYAQEHDGHLKRGASSGQRTIGRGREMIGRHKNGTEFPIELTVGTHRIDGGQIHVGVIRDITERKLNEDNLRKLANTDGLTGVLNRRSFTDEGNRLFTLAERHDRHLAVLMIDADHFKSVNDNHGHDIGDVVLKLLAREVSLALRSTDVFGRLGGEEFAALLPETDPAGAEELAWKIVETVRGLSVPLPDGKSLKFTVSVGIGCRNKAISSLDALMKESDNALYVAKHSGRNRAVRQLLAPS